MEPIKDKETTEQPITVKEGFLRFIVGLPILLLIISLVSLFIYGLVIQPAYIDRIINYVFVILVGLNLLLVIIWGVKAASQDLGAIVLRWIRARKTKGKS